MIRVRRLTREHAAGARPLETRIRVASTMLLVLVVLVDFSSSALRAKLA